MLPHKVQYVTGSAIIPYVSTFFVFPHFLYLNGQRNGPPKFQLWKSRTLSFFFHTIPMTRGKVETWEKKVFANRSCNTRQTNACIFGLLRSADTKQTFSNSSCFGDHGATIIFPFIIYLHWVTSIQNFMGLILNYVKISFTAYNAFYCKS